VPHRELFPLDIVSEDSSVEFTFSDEDESKGDDLISFSESVAEHKETRSTPPPIQQTPIQSQEDLPPSQRLLLRTPLAIVSRIMGRKDLVTWEYASTFFLNTHCFRYLIENQDWGLQLPIDKVRIVA
jgi:hypothetical protein